MTAPFTVTAPCGRPVRFSTLDAARAYARRLLARDVQSVITDSAGRQETYELFGAAS
jgi:hypothetical protein